MFISRTIASIRGGCSSFRRGSRSPCHNPSARGYPRGHPWSRWTWKWRLQSVSPPFFIQWFQPESYRRRWTPISVDQTSVKIFKVCKNFFFWAKSPSKWSFLSLLLCLQEPSKRRVRAGTSHSVLVVKSSFTLTVSSYFPQNCTT